MTAHILDGKLIAQKLRVEIKTKVDVLRQQGILPGLAVVLVGEDPASQIYVRNKTRACQEVGIQPFDYRFGSDTSTRELIELVKRLNQDPRVHGVLIQLPLPAGVETQAILEALDPRKDVDGLLPENVGWLWLGRPHMVPCTPLGVLHLLKEAKTPLTGAEAVVVGRSNLVGRPMAALLVSMDATVTLCHSRTKHLDQVVSRADVVIAALGKPQAIRGAWIKEGATVIDVGVTRLPDGTISGDVEFQEAVKRASVITPVPGGVGPLTIAMLLQNTVLAAESSSNSPLYNKTVGKS